MEKGPDDDLAPNAVTAGEFSIADDEDVRVDTHKHSLQNHQKLKLEVKHEKSDFSGST